MFTGITYTEPVGSKGIMQVNYHLFHSTNKSDKETFGYDEATNNYSVIDSTLSNVFKNYYTTHRIGTGYRFRGNNYFLLAGIQYQKAFLENDQKFPRIRNFQYDFQNIVPMLMLRYNISQSKNLRLVYRPRTNEPSVSQLQNVIDNSNPLQLSVGNPSLNQEYLHNLFIRYSSSNTDKSSTLFALLGGNVANDHIANATLIAPEDATAGSSVSQTHKPGWILESAFFCHLWGSGFIN